MTTIIALSRTSVNLFPLRGEFATTAATFSHVCMCISRNAFFAFSNYKFDALYLLNAFLKIGAPGETRTLTALATGF